MQIEVVELSDLSDSRLDDFIRLTDIALRRKLETERGLYLAEGLKVIERAIRSGHYPRAFLTAPKHLSQLRALLEEVNQKDFQNLSSHAQTVTIFLTTEDQIKEVTGYRIHRGAMGSFNRPELPKLAEFLRKISPSGSPSRIFILEDLVDHTNVGAIFRSAAALGIDGILVTPSCADPLYRRSVKVAMGNVFHVPWTRIESWPKALEELHESGWVTASLALREDALNLREFAALPEVQVKDSKVALVLGTEGDGLSERTIAQTKYSVVIPMRAEVDSLNVAAAGALAAWELQPR
ncbi:MAG: RNA methyltransferase [Arcanobacterium sp.]|nr:RNA methyltransferase [Arcanobacterium sp.]